MATSTIKKPLESELGEDGVNTFKLIGILSTGDDASTEHQFVLPKESASYLIFLYRANASAATTQGLYLVNCYYSSNTKRIVLQPVLAVGGNAVFTGEYNADEDQFQLKLSGITYEGARIYKIR